MSDVWFDQDSPDAADRLKSVRALLARSSTDEEREGYSTGDVLVVASESLANAARIMERMVDDNRVFRAELSEAIDRIETQNDRNERSLRELVDG